MLPYHSTEENASHLPLDRLSCIALIYLGLPVLLFFLGWFQPPPGLALSALACFVFWRTLRIPWQENRPWPRKGIVLLAVSIAIAWSIFGGAGHFFYANAHDWIIRDAVLHDLVSVPWPPGYTATDGEVYALRAPVAYYLPAAVVSKLFGLLSADRLLWLWTAIGISIFFLLLPLRHEKNGKAAIGLLIVVMFSGLDIIAILFPDFSSGSLPLPNAFIDWWVKPPPLVSYWSNTSNLFWNPNHALPAWIAIALFYRHWRHPDFLGVAPLLAALLPLWSPFALVGMLPFLLTLALRWLTQRPRHRLDQSVMLACIVILSIISIWLLFPSSGIHYGLTAITPPETGNWVYSNDIDHLLTYAENYTLFIIFEFGIVALLVAPAMDRTLFIISVLTLLTLPFFSLGPGNDLAMRGSIPSLAILALASVNMLLNPPSGVGKARRALLVVVLAAGAATPYYEFSRSITRKAWQPNTDFTMIDANNGKPAKHYHVPHGNSALNAALNSPTPLVNAVDWRYECNRLHEHNISNGAQVAYTWRANRNETQIGAQPRSAPILYLESDTGENRLKEETR